MLDYITNEELDYITDEELERIRSRACDGKKKYLTEATANGYINVWKSSKSYRKARHMKMLHAYLCWGGGHWHVGHSNRPLEESLESEDNE